MNAPENWPRSKPSSWRLVARGLLFALLVFAAPAAMAADTPRFHTVYSGQRLGSIAKRWNVSVEAICNANDIRRSDRLKVGQKLVIPSASDKDGSRARAYAPKKAVAGKRDADGAASARPERAKSVADGDVPTSHTVQAGQRLESIAKRYGVTVDELCEANKIRRKDTLRPGQVLLIPRDGKVVENAEGASPDFERAPKRKGYVELVSHSARWRGQVIDKKGKLRDDAAQSISTLLGATGKRPKVDPRLIRLLARISDKFGGRPLRIVSGFRTESYFDDSRHKVSRAVDFSIPGVPNNALRDYLRTLRDVGVGYYPNSSFVHLDVRDGAAYWVDYAGPGEAPRDKQHAEDVGDAHLERELNELLKKTTTSSNGPATNGAAASDPTPTDSTAPTSSTAAPRALPPSR